MQALMDPTFAFPADKAEHELQQTSLRLFLGGKGQLAKIVPKGMADADEMAALAAKNAVVIATATLDRLKFKPGQRGDTVFCEQLRVAADDRPECSQGAADGALGMPDGDKKTWQQCDTIVVSAKMSEAGLREVIDAFNGPERAATRCTATMELKVLTYTPNDAHGRASLERHITVEVGLVGDEDQFEVLGTHGLVPDTTSGLVFSGDRVPSNQPAYRHFMLGASFTPRMHMFRELFSAR